VNRAVIRACAGDPTSLRHWREQGLDPSDFCPDPPDDGYWDEQQWIERLIEADEASDHEVGEKGTP
jgi:hypothetical protein